MRIGRFLSHAGLCSRREAASFLFKNKVFFEGKQVSLNTEVPDSAIVQINGKDVAIESEIRIILLHKPLGYVCSHAEQGNKKSIFQLLPEEYHKYYYAGRLDEDSTGLVVLCNKGDIIYNLTHPSQKVDKRYLVTISKPIAESDMEKCLRGIRDGSDTLRFSKMKKISPVEYDITLKEGKNREIRRVFKRLRVDVMKLHRYQVGEFALRDLPSASWNSPENL